MTPSVKAGSFYRFSIKIYRFSIKIDSSEILGVTQTPISPKSDCSQNRKNSFVRVAQHPRGKNTPQCTYTYTP